MSQGPGEKVVFHARLLLQKGYNSCMLGLVDDILSYF